MEDHTTPPGDPEGSGFTAEISAGANIAEYRVIRHLGRGTIGEVYEAEHAYLGRHYALKLLPAELSSDVTFRNRFEQGVRTMAGMVHPNIVEVAYAGETELPGNGRRAYIAMELLEPFNQRRGEQGDESEVANILRQVFSALKYAHDKGVIHGDIKPGNLLLAPVNQNSDTNNQPSRGLKVSDFGLARVAGAKFMRRMLEQTVAKTRLAGVVANDGDDDGDDERGSDAPPASWVNTIHYLPPEVLAGGEPTAQSDLYSIGVMAYEWLTGRSPIGRFKAVNTLRPDLAYDWTSLINGLLEQDPGDRIANATDVLHRLPRFNASRKRIDAPQPKAETIAPPPQPQEAPQPKDSFTLELSDGTLLEMIGIKPGEFLMGSPSDEVGRNDDREGPQTHVRLTRRYWLGKTPVTQRQWQTVTKSNPSHFKQSGLDAPVESVSWKEAMRFCQKLTELEQSAGRLPDGYVYTLASEAQWEYAARAGTKTRWSFGDDESQLGEYAWYGRNSGRRTQPVGTKLPNPWGLHDMHGNVWEWTRSYWQSNHPGRSVTDYEGPESDPLLVFRGGSWDYDARSTRSAYRHGASPDFRLYYLGFRIALSPIPKNSGRR